MSVQQLPALRPQAAAASPCSSQPRVSLPVFPDSAPGHHQQQQHRHHHHQQQQQQQQLQHQDTLCDDASLLPLPDHFPEPYTEDHGEQHHHPHPHQHSHHDTSPASQPTMAQCLAKQAVRNHHTQQHDYAQGKHAHDDHDDTDNVDDARREGLRRITDKYAAPSMLHVNGSVCSSDNYSPSSVSPVDTRPASTTPSSSSFSAAATHQSPSPTPSSPLSGGGLSGSPVMNGRRCAGDPDATPRSCVQTIAGQQQNGRTAGLHYNNHSNSNSRLAALSVSSAFSDASSDMSDASPSPALTVSGSGGLGGMGMGSGRYQSVSGISLSTSLGEGVSGEDVQQVEMFYRSHKAEVTACRCLANLYFGSSATTHAATTAQSPLTTPGSGVTQGRLSPASTGGEQMWEFVTTGIPLLVLDSGDHHRVRQLSLVVAEKGTGFVLWKDVVSHLTAYALSAANFHTLRISSDGGNKLAGLSFDDGKAAAEFASTLLKLTSDPDDELLMLSQKGKKKKKMKKKSTQQQQDSGVKRKKSVKFRPPKKSDISQPCCFQHVTKLERPQVAGLTPLPPNGFPPAPGGGGGGSVSSLSEMLHDRLTVGGGSSSGRARSASSELSDVSVEQ